MEALMLLILFLGLNAAAKSIIDENGKWKLVDREIFYYIYWESSKSKSNAELMEIFKTRARKVCPLGFKDIQFSGRRVVPESPSKDLIVRGTHLMRGKKGDQYAAWGHVSCVDNQNHIDSITTYFELGIIR